MTIDREIKSIGCWVCRKFLKVYSPAEIHHVRKLATSKKRNRAPKIPLCHVHHRTGGYGVALHAGEKKFENNFEPVMDMIDNVQLLLLGERNKNEN